MSGAARSIGLLTKFRFFKNLAVLTANLKHYKFALLLKHLVARQLAKAMMTLLCVYVFFGRAAS
jgi:hypothetical protein